MFVTSKYRRWPQSSSFYNLQNCPQTQSATRTHKASTTADCKRRRQQQQQKRHYQNLQPQNLWSLQTTNTTTTTTTTKLIYGTYSKQQKSHKALEVKSIGCKVQSKCWYEKQNTPKHLQHIVNTSVICWWVNTGH